MQISSHIILVRNSTVTFLVLALLLLLLLAQTHGLLCLVHYTLEAALPLAGLAVLQLWTLITIAYHHLVAFTSTTPVVSAMRLFAVVRRSVNVLGQARVLWVVIRDDVASP